MKFLLFFLGLLVMAFIWSVFRTNYVPDIMLTYMQGAGGYPACCDSYILKEFIHA